MSGSLVDFEPPTASTFGTMAVDEDNRGNFSNNNGSTPRRTMSDPPTPSEPLAQTADAVDAGKAKKSDQPGATSPKVTRQAAGGADAKIKYRHIEVPSYMSGSTRRVEVVVRRKLRRQT